MWRNLKFLHIWHVCDVENVSTMCDLCCFVVKLVLLWFTHFCRKICFVAIYALLCGEKLNQKLPLWRKNDKYEVWTKTNTKTSNDSALGTSHLNMPQWTLWIHTETFNSYAYHSVHICIIKCRYCWLYLIFFKYLINSV